MNAATTDPSLLYYQKKAYMAIVFLILLGAINWLVIGAIGQDLVRLVLPPRYARWVYITIGTAALFLLFSRDVYLPFLGETLLPSAALSPYTPQNANDQVTLNANPGAKIIYWAAEPNPTLGKELNSWDVAYAGYENSGIAVADANGKALLRFRGPPQPYKVPMKSRLESHVHFRVCEPNGFVSRVQTLFLKDGHVEGFAELV